MILNFDLNYRTIPGQEHHIHTWVSSTGFNDTFLIPTNKFREQININYINEYKSVNYHREEPINKICLNNPIKFLDIVYISNGEPDEHKNYELVKQISKREVLWIKGIQGRSEAIKAAANKVKSDYFFCIPAKLQVLAKVDWSWAPNEYYGLDKHYVFQALNPVNNLCYGHMAMVAYNKNLVLETHDPGLDFTLAKPCEPVSVLSGVAKFNQDPKTTWRTAFREVTKLMYFNGLARSNEYMSLIKTWLTTAHGRHAAWSLQGAQDGKEFFDQNNGDYNIIKQSYSWEWLDQYQKQKGYNL